MPNNYLVFLLLIASGYAGQILNTRALFVMSASKTMPVRYINVILAFLIDVLYYGLSFDGFSLTGIVITSCALGYLTLQKNTID